MELDWNEITSLKNIFLPKTGGILNAKATISTTKNVIELNITGCGIN